MMRKRFLVAVLLVAVMLWSGTGAALGADFYGAADFERWCGVFTPHYNAKGECTHVTVKPGDYSHLIKPISLAVTAEWFTLYPNKEWPVCRVPVYGVGIVNMRTLGEFRPQARVTREEYAAVLGRALDVKVSLPLTWRLKAKQPVTRKEAIWLTVKTLNGLRGKAGVKYVANFTEKNLKFNTGKGQWVTRADMADLLYRVLPYVNYDISDREWEFANTIKEVTKAAKETCEAGWPGLDFTTPMEDYQERPEVETLLNTYWRPKVENLVTPYHLDFNYIHGLDPYQMDHFITPGRRLNDKLPCWTIWARSDYFGYNRAFGMANDMLNRTMWTRSEEDAKAKRANWIGFHDVYIGYLPEGPEGLRPVGSGWHSYGSIAEISFGGTEEYLEYVLELKRPYERPWLAYIHKGRGHAVFVRQNGKWKLAALWLNDGDKQIPQGWLGSIGFAK